MYRTIGINHRQSQLAVMQIASTARSSRAIQWMAYGSTRSTRWYRSSRTWTHARLPPGHHHPRDVRESTWANRIIAALCDGLPLHVQRR